jgi:hypothetical protein
LKPGGCMKPEQTLKDNINDLRENLHSIFQRLIKLGYVFDKAREFLLSIPNDDNIHGALSITEKTDEGQLSLINDNQGGLSL